VATTAVFAGTYSSATNAITASANNPISAFASVFDGVTLLVNQRVLFKNQSPNFANGVYTVTNVGSASTPCVFTRATDADDPAEVTAGATVNVTEGATLRGNKYRQSEPVANVDTDPEIWVLDSTSDLVAGPGIVVSANRISFVDETGYQGGALFYTSPGVFPVTTINQLGPGLNGQVLTSDGSKPVWAAPLTTSLPTLEHRSSSAALTITPTGAQAQPPGGSLLWTYTIDPSALVSFGVPSKLVAMEPYVAGDAGIAGTAMRSDAQIRLSAGITPSWTGQHIFNATTQLNATSDSVASFVLGVDTAGAASLVKAVGMTSLRVNLNIPNPAAPTKTVKLAALAGTLTQGTAYLPFDTQLALDQAIAPNWTSAHAWIGGTKMILMKATTGAANPKFSISSTGELRWGDGSEVEDILLYRSFANTLVATSYPAKCKFVADRLMIGADAAGSWSNIPVWAADPSGDAVTQEIQHVTKANFLTGIGAVPTGRKLTFTAGTGISISAPNQQDLSADRTWTIAWTGASAAPTTLVGLAPITGVLTTYMASDSAPALSQAIAPTWSSKHIFNAAVPAIATRAADATSLASAGVLLGLAASGATTAQNVVGVTVAGVKGWLGLSTAPVVISGTKGRYTMWADTNSLGDAPMVVDDPRLLTNSLRHFAPDQTIKWDLGYGGGEETSLGTDLLTGTNQTFASGLGNWAQWGPFVTVAVVSGRMRFTLSAGAVTRGAELGSAAALTLAATSRYQIDFKAKIEGTVPSMPVQFIVRDSNTATPNLIFPNGNLFTITGTDQTITILFDTVAASAVQQLQILEFVAQSAAYDVSFDDIRIRKLNAGAAGSVVRWRKLWVGEVDVLGGVTLTAQNLTPVTATTRFLGVSDDASATQRAVVQVTGADLATYLGSSFVPLTKTITHTSANVNLLTISPTGAQPMSGTLAWTHTVVAAPKLTGVVLSDAFTAPTTFQFFVMQNSTSSVNFPTSFGGGIRFERGVTTSAYGSFMLWAQLIADPAKAELWFSKFVDVGMWSPWKKFVFVGDTATGFVPETRSLTMTSVAPDFTVTNSGTALDLSQSRSWTFTVNSAPKWTSARTLSWSSEVTGSGALDGSANVDFPLTINRAINATWTGFHVFTAVSTSLRAPTATLSTTSQVLVVDLDASATARDVKQVTVSALRGQIGQPTLAAGAIGYGDASSLLTGAANELGWDAANNRMFLATSVFAGALASGYIEHDGLRPWFTPTTTPLARRGVAFLDDIDFTNDASAAEATRLRFNSPSTGKHWAESQIPGNIGAGDYSFCIRLRWPTAAVTANTGVWCLSNHVADGAAANDMGGYIALTSPTSLILFARDAAAGFFLSSAIPMTKWAGRVIDIVVTRTAGVENCYVNGEQQTYTRSTQVANALTGDPLKIRVGSMHTGVLPFPESIYRARFYNRSLSLSEVFELARSGVRMSDRWGTLSPVLAGCILDLDFGAAYQSGSSTFTPDTSLRYNATVYGTFDKMPGHFHDPPSIAGQAAAVPYFGSNGRMIADAGKLAFDGTTFSVFGQAYIQAAAAIGVTVPTTPVAWLELAAGSTTRAPLRLGVGTFTSALTSGSIENNGVRPWYTTSTPTRRGLAFVDELNFTNDPSSERAGAVVFGPNDNVTSRLWNGTTNTEVIGTGPCTLYARILVPEIQRGPGYDCIAFVGPATSNFLGSSMSMALHSNGNLYCFVSISSTDHVRLILANLISNYGGKVVDLVFTRDGTTNPGSLYVDGVLQNITPSTGGAGNPWNLSLNSVYFIVGQGSSGQGSVPRIYRAALFNRYLSAADARALTLYGTHSSDMWGSQTAVFTSNFTASNDGFGNSGGVDSLQEFNQTVAGSAGWLKHTRLNSVGRVDTYKTITPTPAINYKRTRLNFDAHLLAGTMPSIGASIGGAGGLVTTQAVTLATTTSHSFDLWRENLSISAGPTWRVEPQVIAPGSVGSVIVSVPVGTSYAIKNFNMFQIGAIVDLDLGVGCGSVAPDKSGRYHGAINGTTWHHLEPSCPALLPSGGGFLSYGVRRYVQRSVTLATPSVTITHSLGTKDVTVQLWQDDLSAPAKIEVGITADTLDTVKIWPNVFPSGAKATVVVIG